MTGWFLTLAGPKSHIIDSQGCGVTRTLRRHQLPAIIREIALLPIVLIAWGADASVGPPPPKSWIAKGVAPIAAIDLLPSRPSYRHEAFFWRTADDFLASTLPFIRNGLDAGEPVMVAVIAARIALVRAALGKDAVRVHFVDMAELGRNPAHIIPGWQRFLEAHSKDGQPMRGIGEPIWAGRRREEIVECQLHEALLNVAVDPEVPFWLLCPYNSDLLDDEVIAEAHRSHPVIIDSGAIPGSPLYGGARHVEHFFGAGLPELDGVPDQLYFNRTTLQRGPSPVGSPPTRPRISR
jgi:MEDS: MEthanogen/methylotroph, DcmR Sensory domain